MYSPAEADLAQRKLTQARRVLAFSCDGAARNLADASDAPGAALPWDRPVTDAVAALAAARETCGDTFVVDSGPDRYLFTFSARGVSAFYGLPEDHASKGVADWRMLRRKVPDELFDGRRTLPHDLFGRADAATYLNHVLPRRHGGRAG